MASQVHFTRMDPEVRKAHLIDATLVCLKQYGFQGMSVRKICAQAGVSPGLISHHYAGKDELVAEAYQAITRQVMGQLREAMQKPIDKAEAAQAEVDAAAERQRAAIDDATGG